METQMDDLSLKELAHYTGSEGYFDVMGFKATDGIGYIMKNGYSWFVTDFLAVAMFKVKKEWKDEGFICIKLKINEDKSALMLVTDGNEKELYRQKYKWTNAENDLTLYLCDNVLLLAKEY